MESKQKTHKLITELTEHVPEVSPMRKPFQHALQLWAVMFIGSLLVIWYCGIRADMADKLSDSLFIIELSIALIASIIAAYSMAISAVPDQYQRRWRFEYSMLGIVALLGVLIAQSFYAEAEVAKTSNRYQCALDIVLISIFPIFVGFATLRNAASTQIITSSLCAGLTAVYLAYAALRIIEANDEVLHIILWHMAPMIGVCMISVLLGRRFLRW